VEEYDYDAFGTMILGKHIDVSTGAMTDITADTAETSTAFGNNSTIGMPDSAS
jgi:hypothetical protein